ncbi:magnesium transporter NIPA-domain-containing protein [Cunninghamella echinulata]|nr:magnesium transporter NIPA-domain-containing protein [Cunninghamella echinulata]
MSEPSIIGPADNESQAALYKGIGVGLAIGLLIGSSFVFKKKGLLDSTAKAGGTAGEGYHYLKSFMWWLGMILMILGELCNFVAYAFAPAVLVTPLGALSVVISAVLSSIFLKERLTFHGKVGCLQCIIGAVMIVLHAPTNNIVDSSVEGFKRLVLTVGFLVYAGIIVLISLVLIFYCGPKWGKTNMLVYLSICSVIGSISVVFTQGFGTAIVYSIAVSNQFTNWFIYIMLGILIITLVLEIVYLNKALNIFNTALVTPTYYVIFTTMTILSSTILYQGFNASGTDIASCVLGFICICSGVALLHHSSAAPKNRSSSIGSKEDIELGYNHHQEKPKGLFSSFTPSSIGRKNSLFSMFDKESKLELQDYNDNDGHDRYDHYEDKLVGQDIPGPGELFSAPFSGIGRYTSTTRSQSVRLYQSSLRRKSQSLANITAAAQPHDLYDPDEKPLWSPNETKLNPIAEADKPLLPSSSSSSSQYSPSSRRDQNDLNPMEAFKFGLNGKKEKDQDEDRQGLVDK